MINIDKIAEQADVIISGYAFIKNQDDIKVVNLNNCKSVAVFQCDQTMIETNMDDIELEIVKKYLSSSLKYMEK
jgi:hypothetical protein